MDIRERAKHYYEWANEAQIDCLVMHNDLMGGFHHSRGIMRPCGKNGIEINEQYASNFSTFDYNYLTKAVLLAHDRCIRFCISPSGPGMLKFHYHKRTKREGQFHERHPTIEEAIKSHRKVWPLNITGVSENG